LKENEEKKMFLYMKNNEDIKAWDIKSEPRSINTSVEMLKSNDLSEENKIELKTNNNSNL